MCVSEHEESPSKWHGWLWTGRWERACTGDTLETCSRRLGEEGRRRGVPAAHRLLTDGAPPRLVPRGMAPGRQ
jgi:hypothetical protein